MQFLHIAHDAFFYAAYALAALIVLHRALRQAIALPPVPVAPVMHQVNAPADPVDAPAPQPEPVAIAEPPTASETVAEPPVENGALPPIRQLKKLAKGKVRNYSSLTQGQLYQALLEVGALV